MEVNELRLLSISEAAKLLGIRRATLGRLIDAGRLGYIKLGVQKRIPYSELARFQDVELIRKSTPEHTGILSNAEIQRVQPPKQKQINNFDPNEYLQKILERN